MFRHREFKTTEMRINLSFFFFSHTLLRLLRSSPCMPVRRPSHAMSCDVSWDDAHAQLLSGLYKFNEQDDRTLTVAASDGGDLAVCASSAAQEAGAPEAAGGVDQAQSERAASAFVFHSVVFTCGDQRLEFAGLDKPPRLTLDGAVCSRIPSHMDFEPPESFVLPAPLASSSSSGSKAAPDRHCPLAERLRPVVQAIGELGLLLLCCCCCTGGHACLNLLLLTSYFLFITSYFLLLIYSFFLTLSFGF
jgi:hypothetical protein